MLAIALAIPAHAQPRRWQFATEPFAPYTYEQGGQAAGPMVEVLVEVCQRMKIQCRIDVLPWRRALSAAERGQIDGVFTVVDVPERRAAFHVSAPVMEARYTFFAPTTSGFAFQRAEDLRGRTIGVYGPSASSRTLQALAEGTDAEISVEVDNPTVLRKLQAGRYGPQGLAFANEMVAEALIADQSITGLHAAGVATRFNYSFGLSRQRVPEADARRFDAILGQLCRSGWLQEVLSRHRMQAAACQ